MYLEMEQIFSVQAIFAIIGVDNNLCSPASNCIDVDVCLSELQFTSRFCEIEIRLSICRRPECIRYLMRKKSLQLPRITFYQQLKKG